MMSDEETDEEENLFMHSPSFRCPELNGLVELCDEALGQNRRYSTVSLRKPNKLIADVIVS